MTLWKTTASQSLIETKINHSNFCFISVLAEGKGKGKEMKGKGKEMKGKGKGWQ